MAGAGTNNVLKGAKQKVLHRQPDPELTPRGRRQASCAGDYIAGLVVPTVRAHNKTSTTQEKLVEVWTSPMIRCCQTAELIANSAQARALGLAPLPVFVRGDIFEVHGLVSHHKAEGVPPPESDGVSCGTTNLIKNASQEGRTWRAILEDHSGFEAWFVVSVKFRFMRPWFYRYQSNALIRGDAVLMGVLWWLLHLGHRTRLWQGVAAPTMRRGRTLT